MTTSSAALQTDPSPSSGSPLALESLDAATLRASAPVFDIEAWAARTARPGDRFDEIAAAHACAFFPRYLRHTKGQWAGKPFVLEPWQRAIIRTLFGWKRADGTRRFRIAYVEVPKKNGKTALAAGIALYLAFASGEPGAEVYCAANDTKQAMLCFGEAKRMRAQCEKLKEDTNAFKYNISAQATFSKLEAISADVGTKEGLNVSGLVLDEVHVSPSRDLYDTLHTATAARAQPLELLITTAGDDVMKWCFELHEHAERVRDEVIEDHEFLPVIFAAANDDDPYAPATWFKANPSLGVTVPVAYMAKEAQRARLMPRTLNRFKRYHLNVWVEQESAWLGMDKWDACNRGADTVTLDALLGRTCFGGLDLSSTTDLTALVLLFPWLSGGGYDLWCHFWMPRLWIANGSGEPLTIEQRSKRERVPYDEWARQGWITLTEGNVVDYDVMRAMISGEVPLGLDATEADKARAIAAKKNALATKLKIREIARDRWNATQITNQLMADGIEMIEFGQGYASMSAPAKDWEKLVIEGKLNHGGNPVLRWMASVCTVKTDDRDNIKPVKPDRRKSAKRVDGIVAGVMALGRASAPREEKPTFSKGYQLKVWGAGAQQAA